MSYLDLLDRVTLFYWLHKIDEELAAKCRAERCDGCNGPLHDGRYRRKPRAAGDSIPEEYCERLSLCCGHCRKRKLPPSCLFFGRRVYWGVVIILVTSAQQGLEKQSMVELCERFGVSRRTVGRWVSFFAVTFAQSKRWQSLRGRVSAPVCDDALPGSLVEHFVTVFGSSAAMVRLMLFLTGEGTVEIDFQTDRESD